MIRFEPRLAFSAFSNDARKPVTTISLSVPSSAAVSDCADAGEAANPIATTDAAANNIPRWRKVPLIISIPPKPHLCVRTMKILIARGGPNSGRSEEHTSELQSLMRISYAVFCLKKNKKRYKYIDK